MDQRTEYSLFLQEEKYMYANSVSVEVYCAIKDLMSCRLKVSLQWDGAVIVMSLYHNASLYISLQSRFKIIN